MTVSEHSPEPWHLELDSDGEGWWPVEITDNEGKPIVDFTAGDMPTPSIADARLMEAAPDLLEAIERVANTLWDTRDGSYSYIDTETRKMITAAIAKAKGEAQ